MSSMRSSTLRGTFDSFSLPEILELLAASGASGLLTLESPGPRGRVFFVDGNVVYATTRSGDQLIDDLFRMDFFDEEEKMALERRAVRLEEVMSSRVEVLNVFFEYQITDVFVRLLQLEKGGFTFEEGVSTRYETPYSRTVEDVLKLAEIRAAEWEKIREVVPSTRTPFRLAPAIEEDVTIDPRSWTMIAALAGNPTVTTLAGALKIFEFVAARQLAELVRRGLVVADEAGVSAGVPAERDPEPAVEETVAVEPTVVATEHIEIPTMAADADADAGTVEDEREPEMEDADEMTPEEAAQLVAVFAAKEKGSETQQEDVADDLPVVADPEGEIDESMDLAKRWRRLRKDRKSGAHAET